MVVEYIYFLPSVICAVKKGSFVHVIGVSFTDECCYVYLSICLVPSRGPDHPQINKIYQIITIMLGCINKPKPLSLMKF
jgi:hypothetical protein